MQKIPKATTPAMPQNKCYVIAFAGKPTPNFLPTLKQLCLNDEVELLAARLTHGPGCYNLGVLVDNAVPEMFIISLTMALMPAKYGEGVVNELTVGEFVDEVNEHRPPPSELH